MNYIKPKKMRDLLSVISTPSFKRDKGAILAGGTDMMVQIENFGFEPGIIIDAKGIKSLRGIKKVGNMIKIGCLTTVTELLESELLNKKASLLTQSAEKFAATQIRNRSTIGGNICNASPAGDLLPPLYALEAKLKLESVKGVRSVDIGKFIKAPGKTDLREGELLTEISFNTLPPSSIDRFYKLGQRESMAIATVSLAVIYELEDNLFRDMRIALGSVSPTVIRASKSEKFLNGQRRTPELVQNAARMASEECSPISDVRGSADYRRLMVERFLLELLNEA